MAQTGYALEQTGDQVQEILNTAASQSELTAETERATLAEQGLAGGISDEETRAKAAERALGEDIDAEETRAKAAELALSGRVGTIEGDIPAAASPQNQLADKAFVNNSIQTATAEYKGAFNEVSDLHLSVSATHLQIAAALPNVIATADNNDYCYVQIPTADATPTQIASVERYKYNGSAWLFEYALNNSGFTAAQWAALNSGITSGLVAKLTSLPTAAELTLMFAAKQDVISDLSTIRSGASAGSTAVQPATLASEVADLEAADTAEENRAKAAELQLSGRITTIDGKIPVAASDQNQLADKAFVNSSIATATANYKGSYNEVTDLHLQTDATRAAIATALGSTITGADNNDYCYVQIPTADATPTQIARVERYKYNGSAWAFEYELNNSGFTAEQWAALNSGITSGLVTKLSALPTMADLTTLLAGKQDVISDLAAIRTGASAGATAVQPADLASEVDTLEAADTAEELRAKAAEDAINAKIPAEASSSNKLVDAAALALQLLGKQDVISDLATIRSGASAGATAYQKPSGGIPETDLSTALQLALASFITNTTQNLAYYYLKTETYSASQVDSLIAAVKQFQYEAVQTLPTASADTVGKIYLVPSADPHTQNVKDEYITLSTTEEQTTTYYWELIGSTSVDLSNYYTKSQADSAITAAINTALASYSTTSAVSTMISTAINSALQTYATTDYVNARVDEYAGSYRGTYASLAELQATTGNHHNDYAWVQTEDANGNTVNDRYKYNGSAWVFEYRLTNNNFTSAELDAIASGMTSEKTTKLDNLPPTASSSISATTGADTITNGKKFFVGVQGNDGKWTLESLTPAEMQKCAYAYMSGATVGNTPAHIQGTDANGAPQRITPSDLASLLGVDRVQAEYYQSEFYLDLFDKNNHGVQVLFRHKDGHTGIRYRYMEDGQWPSTWIDV